MIQANIDRMPEYTRPLSCAFLAALFTTAVMWKGVPALRHDWFWVGNRSGFLTNGWDSLWGWTSSGMGAPQTHPTSYLIMLILMPLVFVLGSKVALGVFIYCIGLLTAVGGWRLAATTFEDIPLATGSAAFALFNPWVYSQVVAGHSYMILAYAGVMLLLSEVLRRRPNPCLGSLFVVLTLQQLQFFVIALVIALALAFVRRDGRLVVLTGLVMALPTIIGIALDHQSLASIPYNLTWEQNQSVDPMKAWILQGYFAKYTAGYPGFANFALWIIATISGVGAVVAFQRGRAWIFVPICTAIFWLWCTGTKGVVSLLYTFVVLHVHASGLYRELYDLIGLFAVGYVLLAAIASSRLRFLRWVWLGASCVVGLGWIAAPPAQFWLSWDALPHLHVASRPNSRFALLPPFQPLSLRGKGAGLDPDAFVRADNVSPINQEAPSYPSNVALARFRRGDATALAALSVSQVISQPWLEDIGPALQQQVALPFAPKSIISRSRVIRGYLPELSITALPPAVSIANRLGFGEVLFSDVAGLRGPGVPTSWRAFTKLRTVTSPNEYLQASKDWVDVRQAFAADPDLGQGIGGVLTTSGQPLALRGGEDALVFVRGVLANASGSTLVRNTKGYQWISLPAATESIRCHGKCVVAAVGRAPKLKILTSRQTAARPVRFILLLPWLAVAKLPTSSISMLRYNVTFDRGWLAFQNWHPLPHFRVDGMVNGWIIRAMPGSRVAIVEFVALLQGLAQLMGALWVVLLLRLAFSKRRAKAV